MTVKDLHIKAMDLAEKAFRDRKNGKESEAKELFLQALRFEQEAAGNTDLIEPTRSILYRSAAAAAYHAGDYKAAGILIKNGLSGCPPVEIEEELKALQKEVELSLFVLSEV